MSSFLSPSKLDPWILKYGQVTLRKDQGDAKYIKVMQHAPMEAVKNSQRSNGLSVDGEFGPASKKKLYNLVHYPASTIYKKLIHTHWLEQDKV